VAERVLHFSPGVNPKVFEAHHETEELVLKNLPFSLTEEVLRADLVRLNVRGATVDTTVPFPALIPLLDHPSIQDAAGVEPTNVHMRLDSNGQFTGTAFATFAVTKDASRACHQLTGLSLEGRLVRMPAANWASSASYLGPGFVVAWPSPSRATPVSSF
jgi:RNA recognition motif-containing protein